ncbi:MAG: hypothetical protein K5872_19210 [Rhizobiaceae bacterium]|nr:hypothetical protein [Rhizobiaceae bacterium]MCV0408352.1 hypothetical protein [Rhizobiaceae bacterium]
MTMAIEDDWNAIRGDRLEAVRDGFSLVRPTFIFGLAGVVLAVLTALAAESVTSGMMASAGRSQLDPISTGSVGQRDAVRRYTIRRSVLQQRPGSVCIIAESGTMRGDC